MTNVTSYLDNCHTNFGCQALISTCTKVYTEFDHHGSAGLPIGRDLQQGVIMKFNEKINRILEKLSAKNRIDPVEELFAVGNRIKDLENKRLQLYSALGMEACKEHTASRAEQIRSEIRNVEEEITDLRKHLETTGMESRGL